MKKDAKNFLTTENSSLIGEGKKALTSNFHQNNQLISPIKKGTYRGLFFHNLLASEAIWIGSLDAKTSMGQEEVSFKQGRVREKLGSHRFSRIILLYSSRVMMRKSPVSDRKVASFNIPYHDTQWLIISLTFIYIFISSKMIYFIPVIYL